MKEDNLISSEAVGKLVQDERKRQGLTQLQLAGLANTGIRFVSDLENGKGTVQLQKLLAVIAALGLGLYVHSPWDEAGGSGMTSMCATGLSVRWNVRKRA